MVRLPRNEKQTYRLNSKASNMAFSFDLGHDLDLTMTMTIWWPRSGVWIYQIVTGVTSVVGVPSTHLVGHKHYEPNYHFDGLVQERRNSIANALELRLSCTNPSTYHHHQLSHRFHLHVSETGEFLFIQLPDVLPGEPKTSDDRPAPASSSASTESSVSENWLRCKEWNILTR